MIEADETNISPPAADAELGKSFPISFHVAILPFDQNTVELIDGSSLNTILSAVSVWLNGSVGPPSKLR